MDVIQQDSNSLRGTHDGKAGAGGGQENPVPMRASGLLQGIDDIRHLAREGGGLDTSPVRHAFDGVHLLPAHRLEPAVMRLRKPVSYGRMLGVIAQQMRCGFKVNGSLIPAEMLFAHEAFLPVVILQADDRCRRLLGSAEGFPAVYYVDQSALLGLRVEFPDFDGSLSSVVRALFIQHTARHMFGMRPDTEVEVSDIVLRYRDKLHAELGIDDVAMPEYLQSGRGEGDLEAAGTVGGGVA